MLFYFHLLPFLSVFIIYYIYGGYIYILSVYASKIKKSTAVGCVCTLKLCS